MKSLLPALLLLIGCSGCTHYYYAPNMHNVPLFHERNEVRAAVATSTADEINGTELQAAYSVTDHIGVMANFMNVKGGTPPNNGKGHYAEGGAGYFLPFAEKGVFEIYGGFGGGKAFNQYDSTASSTLKLNKFFVQPGIGFSTDYFDAIFSMRVAYLHYTSMAWSGFYNGTPNGDLLYIAGHRNSLLYEPAITIRGGWKYVKIQTQWSGSFNGTSPGLRQEESNLNIGLYFSFAQRFMDKANSRRK